MKNVTITMDEEVARWARLQAAEHDTSVSRFVGEVLRERMRSDEAYERERRAFARTRPTGGSRGRKLPKREEIHDRTALRR